MTDPALGPGPEFDLIRRLTAGLGPAPGLEVGPGDDAAVLEGGWVMSCDLSIEDVHFRRAWLSPEEIGGRAARAALSDLAAMAAEPIGVLLALAGAPADHRDGTLEALGRGARAAAESCGAALLGGDLTRSPGPLLLDVVAVGRTLEPIRRSGARPGDALFVTGRLGLASAVVTQLRAGHAVPDSVRARFARPVPRLAEARWLADTGLIHALIDLSDGLGGDAGHMARASGVGLEIDDDAVPLAPEAEALLGEREAREHAYAGGEDYELLLAADPALASRRDEFERAFPGVGLTRIGGVVTGEGVMIRDAEGRVHDARPAFQHFTAPTGSADGHGP